MYARNRLLGEELSTGMRKRFENFTGHYKKKVYIFVVYFLIMDIKLRLIIKLSLYNIIIKWKFLYKNLNRYIERQFRKDYTADQKKKKKNRTFLILDDYSQGCMSVTLSIYRNYRCYFLCCFVSFHVSIFLLWSYSDSTVSLWSAMVCWLNTISPAHLVQVAWSVCDTKPEIFTYRKTRAVLYSYHVTSTSTCLFRPAVFS